MLMNATSRRSLVETSRSLSRVWNYGCKGLKLASPKRAQEIHSLSSPVFPRHASHKMVLPIMQLRYYAASLPEHTVITMPALSPTMTQGNLGSWKKKIGDQVEPGDVLVEIETDKAQMDFECQDEGYLARIFITEGTKDVVVNKPIAILVENKDDIDAFASYNPEESSTPKPAATASSEVKDAPAPTAAPVSTSQASVETVNGGRIFASPLAKNMANERGISLHGVSGTGPNGRVVKADIENYKPSPSPVAAASPPVAASAASVPAPAPTMATGDAFEDIPLSNIRKVIAQRLTQSKVTIPHYYLTVEIQMDKLLKLRSILNNQSNGAYKLSVNDFIVKAAGLALKEVPEVNASWQDTFIRQFKTSDIAVAVATDSGLITPIVKNVESRGLSAISNTIKELAGRAKENKLAPNEYQGGSFTISNLGMYDISHFTAIINPPHAAILAVGSVKEKLVADAGSEKGFTSVKVASMTLSCDHRVVDGAVGARWLSKFSSYLEDPLKMLL